MQQLLRQTPKSESENIQDSLRTASPPRGPVRVASPPNLQNTNSKFAAIFACDRMLFAAKRSGSELAPATLFDGEDGRRARPCASRLPAMGRARQGRASRAHRPQRFATVSTDSRSRPARRAPPTCHKARLRHPPYRSGRMGLPVLVIHAATPNDPLFQAARIIFLLWCCQKCFQCTSASR